VLVVHEIKIKDRNGLEFCAVHLRVANPQGSAQEGGASKPQGCFENDRARTHRHRQFS